MNIRRFRPDDAPGIARLNDRLTAGGAHWPVWGEGPEDTQQVDPISSRLIVAEDGGEVRGAVWLREHEFWIAGQPVRAGWAKYPVAESLVNPIFGGIPGAMLIRLLREQPRLMALGMGGHGGAFARLLKGMRWPGISVPFYFSIVRPSRVLHRLRYARRTAGRRAVLDVLAFSGLGWLGWNLFAVTRRLLQARPPGQVDVEVLERFDARADAVWERSRGLYDFVARRDAAMLNVIYPPEMPVVRLHVRKDGRDVGWAVVVRRDLTSDDSTPFGPLNVGLVADGLSEPVDADVVVAAAARHLRGMEVDLMFSNQAHPAWGRALKLAGFLSAPSQFAFYRSPQLDKALGERAAGAAFHVNRGDCDGPVFS